MKKIKKLILLLFISVFSCSPAGSSFSPNPDPIIDAEINIGSGQFIYSKNNIDFEVFYHVPESYNATSKVVFVMHGGSRDAEGIRNNMIAKSNEYNFILITPKFSSENFSLGDGYNLGNVYIAETTFRDGEMESRFRFIPWQSLELSQFSNESIFIGDGCSLFSGIVNQLPNSSPRASHLLDIAQKKLSNGNTIRPEEILPIYLNDENSWKKVK